MCTKYVTVEKAIFCVKVYIESLVLTSPIGWKNLAIFSTNQKFSKRKLIALLAFSLIVNSLWYVIGSFVWLHVSRLAIRIW